MPPRKSPAKDEAASPPAKEAAASPPGADAETAEVTSRLAAATLSAAPMSGVAAPSPSPARAAASPGAEPRTPLTRGVRAADVVVGDALPSPALEVRARPDAPACGKKKVTFESSGLAFQASLDCNFKTQMFTVTPEPKQDSVGSATILFSDVKSYALMPGAFKMTLTLKAACAAVLSPAKGVAPAKIGTELSFTFKNKGSYDQVTGQVEQSLVFRAGTFESDFEVVSNNPIGSGGLAHVYLVRRRGSPQGSVQFADKRPKKDNNDFTNEAEMLRRCVTCPFITKIVQFYDKSGPDSQQHLVMELMEGGDLMNNVLLRRKTMVSAGTPWMADAEVRIVTWRVLKALEYMHSLSSDGASILHRDLKPDNVMMALMGPDGCGDCATAKLADLGHAKALDGVSRTFTATIGTAEYAPPEIAAALLKQQNIGHTKALDMWMVGVLLYVCFVQDYPYGGAGDRNDPNIHFYMTVLNQRILSQGLQGTTPEALNTLLPPGSAKAALFAQRDAHGRKLMQALLQRQPTDRLRVEDALRSPWFDGIAADEVAATP